MIRFIFLCLFIMFFSYFFFLIVKFTSNNNKEVNRPEEKPTDEEILNSFPPNKIEKYIRKRKLKNIKNAN